jgi:hypothetical protein
MSNTPNERAMTLEKAVEIVCGLHTPEWKASILLGAESSCDIEFKGPIGPAQFATLRAYLRSLEAGWPTGPTESVRDLVMASAERVMKAHAPKEKPAPAVLPEAKPLEPILPPV